MKKLLMLKGLPGCGKSTWANDTLDDQVGFKRVNKDDLRMMLDHGRWSPDNEKFIIEVRNAIILQMMMSGHNIIVDDTNLDPRHEEELRKIVNDWNDVVAMPGGKHYYEFEIKDFTNVPLEVCLERNKGRGEITHRGVNIRMAVPEEVIFNMYNKYLAPKEQVTLG